MAVTVKYRSIVDKVAKATKTTFNRSHVIIQTLSEVLTDAIRQGDDIECTGIFSIKYTIRTKDEIYKNNLITFVEQVKEIHIRTDIDEELIEKVLTTYYRQIKVLLESGYQVNVKSIGYIEPQIKNNEIVYFSRIAPVLVKNKALFVDFLVLKDNGEVVVKQFKQKDLRFKMDISDSLEIPLDVKQYIIEL